MSLYDESIPQLSKMLRNLDAWLAEAETTATERGFDVDVLTVARLSPDMFPLTRQVQSACDTAKFVASRVSGQDAPSHPDTETTIPALRARITTTLDYLATVGPDAFIGGETRRIFMPALKGGWVTGAEYVRAFALPNFYFHLVTAYGILRHSGVKLGKLKFIGGMDVRPASEGADA